MNCPVCKTPMIVIEYREIELDYCVECMGVWFDSGEIELLMERIGLDPQKTPLNLQPVSKTVAEAKRHCPICGKNMEKVSPRNQQIILDRCKNGDGIWFDSGEIIQALSGISELSGEENKSLRALAGFLNETLRDKTENK